MATHLVITSQVESKHQLNRTFPATRSRQASQYSTIKRNTGTNEKKVIGVYQGEHVVQKSSQKLVKKECSQEHQPGSHQKPSGKCTLLKAFSASDKVIHYFNTRKRSGKITKRNQEVWPPNLFLEMF